MTIEVALLISGVSLAFAIYQGVSNLKRNEKSDAKADASEMTTVIVKLENINTGITEIKSELSNVKTDIKDDREKIIRLEESLKSAWKRIEVIESKKNQGDEAE